jgi:hypothetical protein
MLCSVWKNPRTAVKEWLDYRRIAAGHHTLEKTPCHAASQVPKAWDARREARLVVPTFSSVSLAGTAMHQHALP